MMQTYEILVRNRAVVANSKDMTLVRTSVGIDQVHVLFDSDEWLEFPVTITFAQGTEAYSQTLVLNEFTDQSKWVCESTVEIPWQVIRSNGAIRVTLQGTDSDGRHIITAKGAPLSVQEAGDVTMGDIPDDAPTPDEWSTAYANAMSAVNQAASLVQTLRNEIESIVSEAQQDINGNVSEMFRPATAELLGSVMVGDGLSITDEGVLSADVPTSSGMTVEQSNALVNLSSLAYYAFDTEFDDDGVLTEDVTVKTDVLPVASNSGLGVVRPDDRTITVDDFGVMRATQYVLPAATSASLGGVKPDGTTILNDAGSISVPIADVGRLGVVKADGTSITIAQDGTISASGGGDGGYMLPKATQSQLGGVKVDGSTITIDEDGVISVVFDNADEVMF